MSLLVQITNVTLLYLSGSAALSEPIAVYNALRTVKLASLSISFIPRSIATKI